jgi:hypothetical protein
MGFCWRLASVSHSAAPAPALFPPAVDPFAVFGTCYFLVLLFLGTLYLLCLWFSALSFAADAVRRRSLLRVLPAHSPFVCRGLHFACFHHHPLSRPGGCASRPAPRVFCSGRSFLRCFLFPITSRCDAFRIRPVFGQRVQGCVAVIGAQPM